MRGKIYVPLAPEKKDALIRIAVEELRHPSDQATILLTRAIDEALAWRNSRRPHRRRPVSERPSQQAAWRALWALLLAPVEENPAGGDTRAAGAETPDQESQESRAYSTTRRARVAGSEVIAGQA
jgi:hypothetical protein